MSVISTVALVVFLAASLELGRRDRAGPPHGDVALPGGIPATLYLPPSGDADARDLGIWGEPPPPDRRPPAVVLMHGYSGDRQGVSGLARSLAGAGFAVLAFDARGHGGNRAPLPPGSGFYEDIVAAVDWLRASPRVDGTRLAVMGHSMGAGATLDYATRDSGIDAVVAISGGWSLSGPYRPPNALFLYAEGDPERIHERARELAERVAGVDALEPDRTYGDAVKGRAVRLVEVPGANHLSIIRSPDAQRQIAAWLHQAFGTTASPLHDGPFGVDPRTRPTRVLVLAMLFALPGLGLLVGRLAPALEARPVSGARRGLLWLALALLLSLPLLSSGPAGIVPAHVVDALATHMLYAGVGLLAFLAVQGEWKASQLAGAVPALGAAVVGMVAVYALTLPLRITVHELSLTPERWLVFAVTALAFTPLTYAFALLLRRGSTASATLFALSGRALVLTAWVAQVLTGVTTGALMLIVPLYAVIFGLQELVAAFVYARSHNLVVIALMDAAWTAYLLAATAPLLI